MSGLNVTKNPCVACGRQETIGVAYSHPEETRWWCEDCLPAEFRGVLKSQVDLVGLWAELRQQEEFLWAVKEARLREGRDD